MPSILLYLFECQLYFDLNFSEICPKGPFSKITIGSDTNRWQTITWANDGIVYWYKYASLSFIELRAIFVKKRQMNILLNHGITIKMTC